MLFIIAAVLFFLWIGSVVASYTLNGLAHLLLIVALAVVLIQVFRGRRPV